MAQRAMLDDRSLCSLCGARVSGVASQCGECGSPFDGEFAALTCPLCGSVTPAGPACSMCGSEMPKQERSPLPDSWTAGDVERVPKKKEKAGNAKQPAVQLLPMEVPQQPKEGKSVAPLPPPESPRTSPAEPPRVARSASSKAPARAPTLPSVLSSTQVVPTAGGSGYAPPSPQIPAPAKSSFTRADPTMMDIEAAQLDGKLAGLLLKVNSFAGRRDLMSLRETAVAIVMALEISGVRPPTDENEPLVTRTRVQEVGRRLREADAKNRELEERVRGLDLEKTELARQIGAERKERAADDLLSSDEYQEEGLAVVLRRVRLNLIPLQKSLEEGGDEGRKKALKILEKLEEQLNEVLGKGE